MFFLVKMQPTPYKNTTYFRVCSSYRIYKIILMFLGQMIEVLRPIFCLDASHSSYKYIIVEFIATISQLQQHVVSTNATTEIVKKSFLKQERKCILLRANNILQFKNLILIESKHCNFINAVTNTDLREYFLASVVLRVVHIVKPYNLTFIIHIFIFFC